MMDTNSTFFDRERDILQRLGDVVVGLAHVLEGKKRHFSIVSFEWVRAYSLRLRMGSNQASSTSTKRSLSVFSNMPTPSESSGTKISSLSATSSEVNRSWMALTSAGSSASEL